MNWNKFIELVCAGTIGHVCVFFFVVVVSFFPGNECSKPLMHAIYVNTTRVNMLRSIRFKKINIFLYIVAFWQHLVVHWRFRNSASSVTHIL